MMARLVPGKLHQILIRAVQELEVSDPHIELILAGDGPCAPAIDRGIAGLRNGSRIARVHDVATFLQSLDVAVLLSLHEGSPRSLMEAFAVGLPTIASAIGGIMELTGATPPCIFVRNEVPGVVAALRELKNARIRRSLGNLARSHAEATFGLEQTLEFYDHLYVGGDEPW
jgi:glycosyltransferase involved in cell wall biosynthesis